MTRAEHKEKMYTLVNEWKNSNQSQKEFSRQHQINLHTFRYWAGKYNNQQQNSPEGFISFDQGASGDDICVRYPNGVELYVPVYIPCATLQKIIKL